MAACISHGRTHQCPDRGYVIVRRRCLRLAWPAHAPSLARLARVSRTPPARGPRAAVEPSRRCVHVLAPSVRGRAPVRSAGLAAPARAQPPTGNSSSSASVDRARRFSHLVLRLRRRSSSPTRAPPRPTTRSVGDCSLPTYHVGAVPPRPGSIVVVGRADGRVTTNAAHLLGRRLVVGRPLGEAVGGAADDELLRVDDHLHARVIAVPARVHGRRRAATRARRPSPPAKRTGEEAT